MPDGLPRIQLVTAAPAKPWWESRVLWFNALCAALAAAEAGFGLLQPLLPVSAYAVLAFVLAVGNAVLRVVTSSQLQWRTPGAGA